MIPTYCKITLVNVLILITIFFQPGRCLSFTVGEEKEVGEKLLYAVRSQFDVLDDPDLTQYITNLGDEVIGAAGVQFFNYHFFIIKRKEFNAFAAPSGLIFFHSGLIEKMNTENELVSVLAHEIGHVAKRHISSRIETGKKISVATMGLILASLALGGGAGAEAILAGSLAAGQSASLHFSRLDEEEADLLAYDWMKKLKRHPEGQERMLLTMRQIARYRQGMVPQYLLTHPNPEARLDYVQTLIHNDRNELQYLTRQDDIAFLRFKYRILAQSRDSLYLRGFFTSAISSSRASQTDIMMAKYGLSQLERSENNFPRSLELIDEVIAAYPEKSVFLVDRGIIELESGKAETAFTTVGDAFNRDREDVYAEYSLARVAYALGKVKKAENLYKSVMYKMPHFSKVYFDLGRLSSAQGKTAETSYYLGKHYLIEGKLKLSKRNLTSAVSQENLPPELNLDAQRSLDLIKKLEK